MISSGGALAACVVDGIFAGQDQLGNGEEGETLLQKRFNNAGQCLRSMQGGVVKQHDGARLCPLGYPLGDLPGGEILPVQTVTKAYK